MPLGLAVVVLLVILVGVYIMTRGLPQPLPPPGPCARDSDCPHPQSCLNGACTDAALPGLLSAAQEAARTLYGTLQAAGADFTGTYAQHAASLQASAAAMGLAPPPAALTAALGSDLASGIVAINKYSGVLLAPGCSPARSSACGYYAEIAALTPASQPGAIFAVAATAPGAAAEAPVATAAFPPVAGGLGNIAAFVRADAQARNKTLDSNTQRWYDTVVADAAQASGYQSAITQQAAALQQTGYALYSHLQ